MTSRVRAVIKMMYDSMVHTRIDWRILAVGLLLAGLTACSTTEVRTTEFVPAVQNEAPEQEELLMDVGVNTFDPGVDATSEEELERTNFDIRRAEAQYAPHVLAETLQRTGNWGMVRVLPAEHTTMDVYVNGTLLVSNGETMRVDVSVEDATGRQWFSREYEESISQFNYEQSQRRQHDPFQVIYNRIANDLLEYRQENVSAGQIRDIRRVAELKFARNIAPGIFSRYLETSEQGITRVTRMPAEDDPSLQRIRNIRERDFLFVDTVQTYYDTFARQMRGPYDAWREQSYEEIVALEQVERSATRRFLTGAVAIAGGLAAATTQGGTAGQAGGLVGVGAGAYLVRSGFERSSEAEMHLSALQELGNSLESEVAPKVIELEDRTVRLTGTVQEQYDQWREILAELYRTETGQSLESVETEGSQQQQ